MYLRKLESFLLEKGEDELRSWFLSTSDPETSLPPTSKRMEEECFLAGVSDWTLGGDAHWR